VSAFGSLVGLGTQGLNSFAQAGINLLVAGASSVAMGGRFRDGLAGGLRSMAIGFVGQQMRHAYETRQTGGKFENGSPPVAPSNDQDVVGSEGPDTQTNEDDIVVPENIQIEASGFGCPDAAHAAFGGKYFQQSVSEQREYITLYVPSPNGTWGYLTPGLGPVRSGLINIRPYVRAAEALGFGDQYRGHTHFDHNER
jgi:hypothetical protein